MELPYMTIGNDELAGNKKLTLGESIPCRNCGSLCEVRSHNLEKSKGTLQTTRCYDCGKTYLVGVDFISIWEKCDEVP